MARKPHDRPPAEGNPMVERAICGAKTRAKTPCQHAPVRGRNRCYLHGGRSPGRPPTHGAYADLVRQIKGLAPMLEAIADLEAEGPSMAQEIRTMRARLLKWQMDGGNPAGEALLAQAVNRFVNIERDLQELVPKAQAVAVLRMVMEVVRTCVDPGAWEKVLDRLGSRGLGTVVGLVGNGTGDGRGSDASRGLRAGPLAD